ncbi:MAG TPA: AbrB family transcriptional regulator [Actinobacteria bacterium]|nr:AbrB family transcriptional regulator [Actinomycetota bacterium]
MSITTITKKGQITIPKPIRDRLSIKNNDKLSIKLFGNKAIIEKIPSLLELESSIRTPKGRKKSNWKEIERKTHEARAKKTVKEKY